MDSAICPGCNLRIEPIRVFEKSKGGKQWWRITRCPASVAASISTSNDMNDLVITRNPKWTTADALFGEMTFRCEFVCYTMERTAVSIPTGIYPACKEISPHFGFATPHLTVPGRTYIEIHPANYPLQLEGCIAVGTTIDHDTLDNSDAAFQKMMTLLPTTFTVTIA